MCRSVAAQGHAAMDKSVHPPVDDATHPAPLSQSRRSKRRSGRERLIYGECALPFEVSIRSMAVFNSSLNSGRGVRDTP